MSSHLLISFASILDCDFSQLLEGTGISSCREVMLHCHKISSYFNNYTRNMDKFLKDFEQTIEPNAYRVLKGFPWSKNVLIRFLFSIC